MPLRETEAIVLRTYRLGEADKIVSVFTRQWGRLRAVATGARRTKSRYGSALEPLSYVRLWLFERENRDLLRMNSAELIESFYEMQKDYRVQVGAQFVAEVAESYLPEREVNERAFRLLLAVLRAFKKFGEVDRPLLYFDYWMLRLAGFVPDFERCAACGGLLGSDKVFYSAGAEGLLCENCRAEAGAGQSIPLSALKSAAAACQERLERWLADPNVPAWCRQVRQFLEEVIEAHAEKRLVTRSLLAEDV